MISEWEVAPEGGTKDRNDEITVKASARFQNNESYTVVATVYTRIQKLIAGGDENDDSDWEWVESSPGTIWQDKEDRDVGTLRVTATHKFAENSFPVGTYRVAYRATAAKKDDLTVIKHDPALDPMGGITWNFGSPFDIQP